MTLIEGDAAAIDLGLSGSELRDLSTRVTRIHHVAQVTSPGVARRLAEDVNVGAMREIIEFARVCTSLQNLVVHSSAQVSGNRTGLVLEEELGAGQSFRSVVEETLATAERLARSVAGEIPITVLRPTQIVGDSRTGEVDRLDGPYLLIQLILSSPQELPVLLPTRGDVPMNLVPIDYVVAAADHIGRSPESVGKTFHLTDPRPLTVREVFRLVAESGGRRLTGGFIPSGVTRVLLGTPGVRWASKSPRAFLDTITTPVRYDTSNTDALLSGTPLHCPPFESYVAALVAFVKQRVEERRVKHAEPEIEDPLS
jgi:thioester reductase-like protein